MSEAPSLVGWLFTVLVWLVAILLIATFGAEHLKRTGQRVTEPDTTSKAGTLIATPSWSP